MTLAMHGITELGGSGIAMGIGMATFMLALVVLVVLAIVWLARSLQTSPHQPRSDDAAEWPQRP